MKFSTKLRTVAAASLLGLAGSSFAALPTVVTPCRVTDITVNAIACSGFYAGQLLSGNASDVAIQTEALSGLGFTWDGTTVSSLQSGLGGVTTISFATPLVGLTYLGVHYGGGNGSPIRTPGGTTAFYSLDAGTGLSSLTLAYGASSSLTVYSTTAPVPEPETYALMLAGLSVVGFMARRRKQQA